MAAIYNYNQNQTQLPGLSDSAGLLLLFSLGLLPWQSSSSRGGVFRVWWRITRWSQTSVSNPSPAHFSRLSCIWMTDDSRALSRGSRSSAALWWASDSCLYPSPPPPIPPPWGNTALEVNTICFVAFPWWLNNGLQYVAKWESEAGMGVISPSFLSCDTVQ